MDLLIDNTSQQLEYLENSHHTSIKYNYPADVVLGAQLGDEGKGRLIDILSSSYDIVARCNSGGNAGHKVIVGCFTYSFHLVPSGILNPIITAIIGNGCVINLTDLKNEIESIHNTNPDNLSTLNITNRLFISDRAHIVLDLHKDADTKREQIKSNNPNTTAIGTTKQGMGPVYATKALRVGLRMCDLFLEYNILREKISNLIDELNLCLDNSNNISCIEEQNAQNAQNEQNEQNEQKQQKQNNYKLHKKEQQLQYQMDQIQQYIEFYRVMVIDTIVYLNKAFRDGKKILVEGAQACLLDVDFGVYPFCTATNCTAGSICVGLGIPPSKVGTINYVMKTYCTRVGNGPFPTEQINSVGEKLQSIGNEYGTTTGRLRRCGWLDIPMVKWAITVNGSSDARICINKLDILDTFDEIKIATKYWLPLSTSYTQNQSSTQPNTQMYTQSQSHKASIQTTYNNKLNNIEYKNHYEVNGFPASLETLAQVKVEYETFKGWKTPTTHIRNYDDLPINAKIYLSRISELLQIPIKWIGVGSDRKAIISVS